MGNTLAEVDQALNIFNTILPEIEVGASIFAPQFAAVLAPFIPIFAAGVKAVDVVSQDGGKPILDVIQDVVSHLTPGQPNAPALSPTAPATSAPPVMSTQNG